MNRLLFITLNALLFLSVSRAKTLDNSDIDLPENEESSKADRIKDEVDLKVGQSVARIMETKSNVLDRLDSRLNYTVDRVMDTRSRVETRIRTPISRAAERWAEFQENVRDNRRKVVTGVSERWGNIRDSFNRRRAGIAELFRSNDLVFVPLDSQNRPQQQQSDFSQFYYLNENDLRKDGNDQIPISYSFEYTPSVPDSKNSIL